MDLRYDISNLIDLAFGIKSPVFIPYPIELNVGNPAIGYPGVELMPEQDYGETDTSWMGTKILYPVSLQGGSYQVFNEEGAVELSEFGDFKFPPVTLVDFSRRKIQTKTVTNGGKSTVKQVGAFEDWNIRIRGLCLNEYNGRTAQQYKEGLLAYEQILDSIPVYGSLFFEKGIDNISINSITFRQLEGKPGVIPFEIEADSDYPIEYRI